MTVAARIFKFFHLELLDGYHIVRYLKSDKPVISFANNRMDAHDYLDRLPELEIQATLTEDLKPRKFKVQDAEWAAKQIRKSIATKKKLSKKKKRKEARYAQ